MPLQDLPTPCLLLDTSRLARNLASMDRRLRAHGVPLRPHVKTAKCVPIVAQALGGQPGGITVSTLKEAEQFHAAGFRDILYAVGIVPLKLPAIARLRRQGAEVTVVLDSMAAAEAVAAAGADSGIRFPVLIEVDCDGHRSGVHPDDPLLLELGRQLAASPGTVLRGVMTHAGGAYERRGEAALSAIAEQERLAVVACAERLRNAGCPCPVVSLGSTPTARFGASFAGVTEVRAGTYMFFDLVMAGLGVCRQEDIAISVLASVIGNQPGQGRILIDAGWTALSQDQGLAEGLGYGVVCDLEGRPIEDLVVSAANQEHGVVTRRGGGAARPMPLGSRVRILPNHACATAAQHDAYHLLDGNGQPAGTWPRFSGW